MKDPIERQAAIDRAVSIPMFGRDIKMVAVSEIENLPSAQPDVPNTNDGDMISRQAAIDALHMHLMYRMGTDSNKKRLDEWINGLPSAQETHEERTETHACDLIDRQAAIDIERNATVDTNPMHFEAHQKFTQFMDDAEISSFGRWQWSNGFNTALTAVGIDLKKLPSAQPEQITCKDCNHCTFSAGAKIYCDELDMRMYQWDYCSRAERREE